MRESLIINRSIDHDAENLPVCLGIDMERAHEIHDMVTQATNDIEKSSEMVEQVLIMLQLDEDADFKEYVFALIMLGGEFEAMWRHSIESEALLQIVEHKLGGKFVLNNDEETPP